MSKLLSRSTAMAHLGAVVTLSLLFAASSAPAAPVLFDPTGTGNAGSAVLVNTFDELPGNALAQNAQALITQALAGLPANVSATTAPFTLYYQANISLLSSPNGTPINTGNNVFTAVAKFSETATVTGGSNTVTFNLAANQAGSYFDIFAHPPGTFGNNSTGTGFSNDLGGVLIYSATAPTSGPSGNFTNSGGSVPLDQSATPTTPGQTVTGSGSSTLVFNTAFFNPNYFIGNPGQNISFQSDNQLPFKTTNPSLLNFQNLSGAGAGSTFVSYVPKNIGAINGTSGPDVQFQADASSAFTTVPEPASVVMTLLGLSGAGIVGFAKRRRAVQA